MADISGIVNKTSAETPGRATVILFNEGIDTVVDTTESDPATGAYVFTGLPSATNYYVMVLGDGKYRSRVYGPATTA